LFIINNKNLKKMAKIISIILLSIFSFNNFANATLWPSNKTGCYESYNCNTSKKNMEVLNYCKEKNYQTSASYSNCLKAHGYGYFRTNTASNYFLY
jgi:hypothetical protein